MTLKVEPVIQWTIRPKIKTLRFSASGTTPSQLDSWHKVKDNESGVTYLWNAKECGHESRHCRPKNAKHSSSLISSSGSSFSSPVARHKEKDPLRKDHFTNNLQRTKCISLNHPSSEKNRSSRDHHSVYHTRPTVVLRKPRTRRFIRTLLCCFGAKPVDTPRQVPLGEQPPSSPYSPKPSEKLLLPPVRACDINKKCLIIDLDETLVHSSFKPVKNPDFVIPVEIDGVIHQVYVLKRPYVDEFLQRIGDLFECILFTASLAKYADPVADLLDKWGVFRARLFREACVFHKGNYVKDLNRLGRDLKRVVIVDNSPASYSFHPDNAIPVQSWFDDMSDTELLDLVPILERLAKVDNVYSVLRNCNEPSPPPPSLDHQQLHGNGSQLRVENYT